MVREFTLVDGSGEEYSLTNEEHLLYNPSGLGFEHENTYRQVGNRFILANSVPKQSVISGTVHFSAPNAYYDYQEFIEFCGRDNLKMEYRLSEMPSRRVKRLIGTVDWIELGGEKYAGRYDFITGDYTLTEKILECDENTIVEQVGTFADGRALMYSISISENRDTTELTYCNGLPARNIDRTDYANHTLNRSNGTYIGGNSDKIYFSLHRDALQGKTISQWIVDNAVMFSYTLATPIIGNDPAYKFNPKLMYNPMVNFYAVNDDETTSSVSGSLSYEDSNQEIVTLEGAELVLENTVLDQELDSLIVYRELNGKMPIPRFPCVNNTLVTSTYRNALSTGDTATHSSQTTGAEVFEFTYVYDNLPIAYLSDGSYNTTGQWHFNVNVPYWMTSTPLPGSYPRISITLDLDFVKSNGDSTYSTVANIGSVGRNGSVITQSVYATESFTVDYAGAKYFSADEINGIIYPSVHVQAISNNPNLAIQRIDFTLCRGNIITVYNTGLPHTGTDVSNIEGSTGKSIAQISQADSQHYQRAVRLNKVEKTELTKFSSLETKVEFECLEPWGDPFTSFVEHGTSPDPVNSITFDTDCHALSPCDLYISGPCTNPTWIQTVNGVEVTTGGYTGTIASGEQLLIRAKDGACGIYLINGSGNIDDVYKYSDFSKDRFVFIRYGENVITVTDGTDPTTQIDCYIEGELYYESV